MPRRALTALEADIVWTRPDLGLDDATITEADSIRRRFDGDEGLDVFGDDLSHPGRWLMVTFGVIILSAVSATWVLA